MLPFSRLLVEIHPQLDLSEPLIVGFGSTSKFRLHGFHIIIKELQMRFFCLLVVGTFGGTHYTQTCWERGLFNKVLVKLI